MLTGFAVAGAADPLGLGLGLGAAVGPQATTTPAAARDWRNRLREMVRSEFMGNPPLSEHRHYKRASHSLICECKAVAPTIGPSIRHSAGCTTNGWVCSPPRPPCVPIWDSKDATAPASTSN